MRVQLGDLGCEPRTCPKAGCVYNLAGMCDEPSINKGNGDASCHRMNNKDVLAMLGRPGIQAECDGERA